MSDRKNNFKKFSENRPKPTSVRPVMDERGKKDLPHGTKGGEKMKPDLHEIHKQHTFDSFCKKVLKHEANNGHRDINHRALWEIPMSDLPEVCEANEVGWQHCGRRRTDRIMMTPADGFAICYSSQPERATIFRWRGVAGNR